MVQPETLQSLLDRLNSFYFTEAEFKDIKIKAAELIKQLFPNDSATTVYEINTLGLYGQGLFESKNELRSILEAKLQTILRKEQIRIQLEKNLELQRIQNEDNRLKTSQIKENEYISKLQVDLNNAYDKINGLYELNEKYSLEADSLREKLNKKYRNEVLRNWSLWGVIVAICALFLGAGYYWGNSRFDSEKFLLKDQRDFYKNQLDSLKKIETKKTLSGSLRPQV